MSGAIHYGPRGGAYQIDATGKKVYIKQQYPLPAELEQKVLYQHGVGYAPSYFPAANWHQFFGQYARKHSGQKGMTPGSLAKAAYADAMAQGWTPARRVPYIPKLPSRKGFYFGIYPVSANPAPAPRGNSE